MNKELKALRKEIRGHYSKIAELAGVTISTVSLVLNGKYLNEKIIDAALKVRDMERIRRQKDETRLINKLKNK